MSNTRRIAVLIGQELHVVGDLLFEEARSRAHSVFRYRDEWLNNPMSFPLSPDLILDNNWRQFSGIEPGSSLPNAIADAAPDDWGRKVIRASIGHGVSELDYLLGAADATRTGALRFMDEEGVLQASSASPTTKTPTLMDLRRLNEQFEESGESEMAIARELRGTGGSLGGARPKSAIYDGTELAIAKYTSTRDAMPVERMEVATLNLARHVGICAPQARIELGETQHPVAIIKRFDRLGEGRRHFISARSFLNIRAASTEVFYTDIVDMMRHHCGTSDQALEQIEELYKRVMFTILVSNNDDHLKNHGFLYAGENRWELSPMFDVNPQPVRHRQLKTGISEMSGHESSIEALIEAAPFFEIEESKAASMASSMAKSIQARWHSECADVGMTAAETTQYEPAFDHKEMSRALAVESAST